MRQVQFHRTGTPAEVVECVEVPSPDAPAGDEVIVAVEAFQINPADLLLLRGVYPRHPANPNLVGNECVGVVKATGPEVKHLSPGDRVISLRTGNWSERLILPEAALLRVPGSLDADVAAGLKVNPATASMLLKQLADLRPGDWVIQNAANSSVGRAVIEIAADRGFRTINIVRRPDIADELMALGADKVLVDGDDLAERVEAATEGRRPRLALDAVSGDGTDRLAASLGECGLLVVYGAASGQPMQIDPARLVFRGLTVRGFWLTQLLASAGREETEALYAPVLDLAARGAFHPKLAGRFSLSEIAAALTHAEATMGAGKTLVFCDSQ
jgi:NADPH:quinone reductase-like Zn-dependent oxidoreductase